MSSLSAALSFLYLHIINPPRITKKATATLIINSILSEGEVNNSKNHCYSPGSGETIK
jgi:hypothetical protein